MGVAGVSAVGAMLGLRVPFARHFPEALFPAALANTGADFKIPGKDPGLTILNDRPINAETPAHLLDDAVTPASRLFVRNNGHPPSTVNPGSWSLSVEGESVPQTRRFSIDELMTQFERFTYRLVLECAGNGRKEFHPPARGNQWTTGAVGCVDWTGIRLRDLLKVCRIDQSAVYVAYEGADTHLSGAPTKKPISRGVPLHVALGDQCLVAWAMNGRPIPALHGHPLRLVVPGMPGSCSGKWLTKILVRDRVHDGAKMNGKAYRMPCAPVAPGTQVPDKDMCIIESMPVKSLITSPRSGLTHSSGSALDIRGHAWTGKGRVDRVHISIDFGASWHDASVDDPKNPYAWQRFSHRVSFPTAGYYEVWARATDSHGQAQPMVLPGWNPKGYLNNACHRIALQVRA